MLFGVVVAVHAVVEVDDVEVLFGEDEGDLGEERGVAEGFGGRESGDVGFAFEVFLDEGAVLFGDGVADEKDAGERLGGVGVGDPDVEPFDDFAMGGGLGGGFFGERERGGEEEKSEEEFCGHGCSGG